MYLDFLEELRIIVHGVKANGKTETLKQEEMPQRSISSSRNREDINLKQLQPSPQPQNARSEVTEQSPTLVAKQWVVYKLKLMYT